MAACTYQVGRVKVHLVSDGVFWTDGGTNFGVVPKTLWEKVIQADELNRIPMQLRCLLIESEAGLILVDTGYGDKLTPKQQAQLNLHGSSASAATWRASGYKPEDVAIVVDTHLHGDHCGGNTKFAEDGSDRAGLSERDLHGAAARAGRRDLPERAHAQRLFSGELPAAERACARATRTPCCR